MLWNSNRVEDDQQNRQMNFWDLGLGRPDFIFDVALQNAEHTAGLTR